MYQVLNGSRRFNTLIRGRYASAFIELVQNFKSHLQDVHCIEPTKRPKRRRAYDNLGTETDQIKRSRHITLHDTDININIEKSLDFEYGFVANMTKTVGRHSGGAYKNLHRLRRLTSND